MPTDPAPKLLLGVRDAAKALSVCERTLFSLTAPRGPIPAVRLGTRVLYSVVSLQSWIDGQVDAAVQGGNGDE